MLITTNITTVISTAPRTLPITATGPTVAITAMYGVRFAHRYKIIPIGRHTVMASGAGFRHTAGRGSMTSPGDGRHITLADGFGTILVGCGRRTPIIAVVGAGGSRETSM